MGNNLKLGDTKVLGIVYWDKNGKSKVVKPHPVVQKHLEEYLDIRNGTKTNYK